MVIIIKITIKNFLTRMEFLVIEYNNNDEERNFAV